MTAASESCPATDTPQTIAGIVLAAGESSRMGTDKALLKYSGRTFLENIISALQDAGVHRIVVVLGHHADLIQQRIDLSTVEVVVNRDYGRGQTSSLQAGLRLLASREPDGVLLCLVDHPALSTDTITQLIHNFITSGAPVVVPQVNGTHGHPVLMGRELFSRILALGPDLGADTVIHQYRHRTEFLEVSDPGVLLDVDDPEHYSALPQT